MSKDEVANLFDLAAAEADKAIALYSKPLGGGARQSIEVQGIQALAEAIKLLANGMSSLTHALELD